MQQPYAWWFHVLHAQSPSSCHDATGSQNLASLFHSGFILFPRFKLRFHSMYACMPLKLNMELENEHLETPLQVKSSFLDSRVYCLHRSAAKGSRCPIRHPSGLYSSGTACINDSLVIKIGNGANFGLWNVEKSDKLLTSTTN